VTGKNNIGMVMADYAIGTLLEITIDNSHTKRIMTDCARHRVDAYQVLKGILVDSPNWLRGKWYCLQGANAKVLNMIPEHRVVSINDEPVVQKQKVKDRVFNFTSSKTGEVYTVTFNGITKRWHCTCVGFQFHNKCRHIIKGELVAEKIISNPN
jgi:hypothetical protein